MSYWILLAIRIEIGFGFEFEFFMLELGSRWVSWCYYASTLRSSPIPNTLLASNQMRPQFTYVNLCETSLQLLLGWFRRLDLSSLLVKEIVG